MNELVFMVEEHSMKTTLGHLLPQVVPYDIPTRIISHRGKSDLEASIPRKLRAWSNPNAHFIVLRDNDGGNCTDLKSRLNILCANAGRPRTLIRIVCQELESWFLGDLTAIALSGLTRLPNPDRLQRKVKYRNPDLLANAKDELRRLAPRYKPLTGSREIAKVMEIRKNVSPSFKAFVSGVSRLVDRLED